MAASRYENFAYLFERFPAFTQTFCFREVLEMRRQGVLAPLWSIHNPMGEPRQNFPSELDNLTEYLPESFEVNLRGDTMFRRQARRAIGKLRKLWGDEKEKRRIYEALWLLPKLRQRGISHVHTHFAGSAARTAFWLKKLGGIRYSFTAHANDIFCDEPHERLSMLMREAECVITVSNFSEKFLQDHFPDSTGKIFQVYNGIDLNQFRRSNPNPDRPLILSIGRYIEKKGFKDLIAACGQLGNRSFECLIIGEGPLENELRDFAAQDARIQITGPKSEGEIVELLARTSLFVLPCRDDAEGGRDNLPTVIMEAMAAAVPVISTCIAGIPEMVVEGSTGYLVTEKDVDGIAARLRELLDDPQRAAAMGAAGRALCENRFATEHTTKHLREILSRHGAFEFKSKNFLQRFWGR